MSKIIQIQDSHISGKNSKYRIGDYYSDTMDKIKETIQIARDLKAKYIIHAGDLYHSSNVSNIMSDEFIDLVEKSKIPWYIIPGNHDLIGHDWKLSKSTTLAHIFRRCPLIKILNTLEGENYYIEGYNFYHNIEKDIKDNGLVCKDKSDKWKIAITHMMLTLKPFHPSVLHIVAKDCKTNYDVVANGHYHKPWGIKEINRTKFVNIGSLTRRTKDEMDIKPSVLLIDTDTRELKIIELKTVKLSNEVFDLEKIKTLEEFDDNIDEFIASIEDAELESIDLIGKIEEIGKISNADRVIIDELVNRANKFKGTIE